MTTENQSRATPLNEIKGEISDAELNNVSGGAKPKTTKTTPKPTTDFMVIKLENVFVSSY